MDETKEYLCQIECLIAKIEQKKRRVSEYRELALSTGSPSYMSDRVQASCDGDRIERKVHKYIMLEQEIENDIEMLQQKKDKIIKEIHNLDNANHIKLLYKRYVECKNLNQVAREMGYSYDHIRSLHSEALKNFKKNKVPTKSHNEM